MGSYWNQGNLLVANRLVMYVVRFGSELASSFIGVSIKPVKAIVVEESRYTSGIGCSIIRHNCETARAACAVLCRHNRSALLKATPTTAGPFRHGQFEADVGRTEILRTVARLNRGSIRRQTSSLRYRQIQAPPPDDSSSLTPEKRPEYRRYRRSSWLPLSNTNIR